MENEKKLCMNAQEAIAKAEQELSTSFYIADISRSPGMKVIHSNRCRWLSVIVGLAKKIASGKAVEVVRCKDCDKSKRSPVFGDGWRFCKNNQQHHRDDHFCSYGERREGE